MQCGYNYREIYLLFKKYSQKIKYFEKMKSGGAGITTGGSGGSSFAGTPSTSISSSSTSAVNMSMSGLSATGISSMPGIFGMSGSSVIDVSL